MLESRICTLPPIRRDAVAVISPARLPSHRFVISTLTATVLSATPDASHWVDHARRAVLFEAAVVKAACEFGCTVFLEVGM